MRILHMMLSCFYIDGWNYQENALPRQNILDGHDVQIIASTETFTPSRELGYVSPARYTNEDGIEVIRIPYENWLPLFIMKKIRAYQNCYPLIEKFSPDVILFHGTCAYELLTIAKYKKNYPLTKIFVDSHEDFHNSARTWLSRQILHRCFYGPLLRKVLPDIDSILCASIESMDFLKALYSIPQDKMHYFPLGGRVILPEERGYRRRQLRNSLGLSENEIMMVHSGKMESRKKTLEILKAFTEVKQPLFRLFLIGSLTDEIRHDVEKISTGDSRITFVGWKSPEELLDFLCAADIYLQPGTQSASMQNALCCSCPVMLYPYKSHEPFLKGNGFFVKNIHDIINVLSEISANPSILNQMSSKSYDIACQLLDYKETIKIIYN